MYFPNHDTLRMSRAIMTSSIIAGVVVSCNQGIALLMYVAPTTHASIAYAFSSSKNWLFVDKGLSQEMSVSVRALIAHTVRTAYVTHFLCACADGCYCAPART